jgi:hypothetical protein
MKLFKVYIKVWEPLCCVDANCVPFCQCLICGGESQVGFLISGRAASINNPESRQTSSINGKTYMIFLDYLVTQ